MHRGARVVIGVMAAGALGLVSACGHGTAPGAPSTSVAPPGAPAVPVSRPDRPDHVMIVVLENKDEQDVAREAPSLLALAGSGAVLTDMHAETHPSQPNYLALFSGDTHDVQDDRCPLTFDGPSLGGELAAAGYTFSGYAEDLPRPGFLGCSAGDYARKHSPWTGFRDVSAGANQPLSALPTDYANLPTVSFVIPNLCHDMHDCSIAEGDRWVSQNVGPYGAWARSHNSLLIVTFDESESTGDRTNHIATLAVGQRVPAALSASGPTTTACSAPSRTSTAFRRWAAARAPPRSARSGTPAPDQQRRCRRTHHWWFPRSSWVEVGPGLAGTRRRPGLDPRGSPSPERMRRVRVVIG